MYMGDLYLLFFLARLCYRCSKYIGVEFNFRVHSSFPFADLDTSLATLRAKI